MLLYPFAEEDCIQVLPHLVLSLSFVSHNDLRQTAKELEHQQHGSGVEHERKGVEEHSSWIVDTEAHSLDACISTHPPHVTCSPSPIRPFCPPQFRAKSNCLWKASITVVHIFTTPNSCNPRPVNHTN